jgi:ATP-dependent DNA helicase Q1
VATQLKVLSGGRIKTGVYHADIAPKAKESLHEAWREGSIKVVCATIGDATSCRLKFLPHLSLAFGMGIDKGDVRFVLHHSVSLLPIIPFPLPSNHPRYQ